MPRCCNDNKSLSPVNADRKNNNSGDILLAPRDYTTKNSQVNIVAEKSHRRLRCDLSPVQTNSTPNYNIKFLSIKVIVIFLLLQVLKPNLINSTYESYTFKHLFQSCTLILMFLI